MNKFAIIEFISKNIKYTEEEKELIKAIEEARAELYRTRQYFEMVNDPQLVDYAIYMEQAAKSRFVYLLKQAKESGIKLNNKFLQSEADAVV